MGMGGITAIGKWKQYIAYHPPSGKNFLLLSGGYSCAPDIRTIVESGKEGGGAF